MGVTGYVPFRSRCGQPAQQHGRRSPRLSLSSATLMRRARVSGNLALVTQQINSFRASGVISSHAAKTLVLPLTACLRSFGSGCAVPPFMLLRYLSFLAFFFSFLPLSWPLLIVYPLVMFYIILLPPIRYRVEIATKNAIAYLSNTAMCGILAILTGERYGKLLLTKQIAKPFPPSE